MRKALNVSNKPWRDRNTSKDDSQIFEILNLPNGNIEHRYSDNNWIKTLYPDGSISFSYDRGTMSDYECKKLNRKVLRRLRYLLFIDKWKWKLIRKYREYLKLCFSKK